MVVVIDKCSKVAFVFAIDFEQFGELLLFMQKYAKSSWQTLQIHHGKAQKVTQLISPA